jgi:hypothetical protein
MLEILEDAKEKYNMSLSLAQFEISDRVVFKSISAGVEDWEFP